MNFFLPGFFDSIGRSPKHCLSNFEGDTIEQDTAFLSTALLTLLVLMTIVEVVILVLCTLYSWFKFPFSDFQWIDDEEENDILSEQAAATETASDDKERFQQIVESLEERIWNETNETNEHECVICLNDFQQNDVVVSPADRKRRCRHVFHKKCLHQWLQIKSSCPCCRQKLVETPVCKTKHEQQREESRISPSSSMTTTTEEEEISLSLTTPWTTEEARPAYVQLEDAWGFCLFLF
jgi:hypothetical protein